VSVPGTDTGGLMEAAVLAAVIAQRACVVVRDQAATLQGRLVA
jgi:hypothetical protein